MLRRIYSTGYTNEAVCFRGCRGEGDEGGGTDDGRRGAKGRGCCCDDLERYQRVARESERAEGEKEENERKGSGGEERRAQDEEERGRPKGRAGGGARAVDVGTSVSRCEGRNRSLPGSQGVSRVE